MNTTVSTGTRGGAVGRPASRPRRGGRPERLPAGPGTPPRQPRPSAPLRQTRPVGPARGPLPADALPPAGPLRQTRPAGRARGPGRPRPEGLAGSGAVAAVRGPASRTPFILLVVALLGGGLVCLLVINTTLAAASFRIGNLQRENAAAAQRVQELQQQVSTDRSANAIEQRARRLGLREQRTINVIDLQTGRRFRTPNRVPGVYAVPGYTP